MFVKEDKRKCLKCGSSPFEDGIKLFRFLKPGTRNLLRSAQWVKYTFPDKEPTFELERKLYSGYRALCERHFKDEDFVDASKKKLLRTAVPVSDVEHVLHFDLVDQSKPQQKSTKVLNKVVVFTARGLMPPVFTILNDDLTINYTAILPYAKFLANNGIKSVLVGGTTGEHMSFSVADRKKMIDAWVAAGKQTGLHIMVQVAGAPLPDVIALAQYSQQAGADSLLTLPELYFKPTSVQELVSYVREVAKAAPKLPVLYYHIPAWSKVEINMPAFVAAATAQIPNFKGIKFTSNDLSEGAQVLRTLKGDQEIFLGADTLLAPAALLGINSGIGTSFNLFPGLAREILAAVEASDVAKARALQEKLCLAIEAITAEGPWVPTMKAGMEIVTGIKTGPPALPQRPVSSEARNRIQMKLKALGI